MSRNHSDRSFLGLIIIMLAYIFLIYYVVWIVLDILEHDLKFEIFLISALRFLLD